jgi:hypothetical protein
MSVEIFRFSKGMGVTRAVELLSLIRLTKQENKVSVKIKGLNQTNLMDRQINSLQEFIPGRYPCHAISPTYRVDELRVYRTRSNSYNEGYFGAE